MSDARITQQQHSWQRLRASCLERRCAGWMKTELGFSCVEGFSGVIQRHIGHHGPNQGDKKHDAESLFHMDDLVVPERLSNCLVG